MGFVERLAHAAKRATYAVHVAAAGVWTKLHDIEPRPAGWKQDVRRHAMHAVHAVAQAAADLHLIAGRRCSCGAGVDLEHFDRVVLGEQRRLMMSMHATAEVALLVGVHPRAVHLVWDAARERLTDVVVEVHGRPMRLNRAGWMALAAERVPMWPHATAQKTWRSS